MDKKKIVPFYHRGGVEMVSVCVNAYENNDHLFVGLISMGSGIPIPFTHLTFNVPGYPLNPSEAFVNVRYIPFILDNQLGRLHNPPGLMRMNGGISIVEFNMDRLREFDPDGVAEVERIREAHARRS